jgi:hypothetical protein
MDTPKAIFAGLALIALAIFAKDIVKPADAGLMGGGRYMGVPGDQNEVWVIDTENGMVRQCGNWRNSISEDAVIKCSAWGG